LAKLFAKSAKSLPTQKKAYRGDKERRYSTPYKAIDIEKDREDEVKNFFKRA